MDIRLSWKFLAASLIALILFTSHVPVEAADHEQDCGGSYTVRRGDWLRLIAYRCGVTVEEILELNPSITNPTRIFPGQVIQISGQEDMDSDPLPARVPDELPEDQILSRNPSIILLDDSAQLPEAQGTSSDRNAGSELTISELAVYIVKRGDRLSTIARKEGTSVAALLDLNPDIENPHRISVGQKLVIPPEGYEPSQEAKDRASNTAIPPSANAPIPSVIKPGERWIDVNLSTQTVHAYEGDQHIRSFLASTGRAATPTITGQFRIYVKLLKTDMRGPGYHLRDVPHTMYFHGSYGLHGTFWHNNFGTPMSAGCVNLSEADAEWLYNFASVGTLVRVHR
jgi:lipoprotein-anchoring transpeptidase ErfK/SrfK